MNTYNKILEKIILPIGDIAFKSQYTYSLTKLRYLTEQDENTIIAYQKEQLVGLLSTATSLSSYYKELDVKYDADPFNWLKNFPILTKDIVKDRQNDLLTSSIAAGLIKNQTSGSTGKQTAVYVTKKEQSFYRAAQTLWWEWAGFKIGMPMVQTGLASKRSLEKRLKDFFFRTHYLFAFGISEKQANRTLTWSKGKNAFLGGYASSLYVLAEKAEKLEANVKFKSAVSWGDKLFDHYRKKVEDTFKCRVYETYGAGEGIMIAAQYDLPWMYIMSPCVFLEIVDDQGNEVKDGEMGHVLVTSLTAFTMPIIRYRLGDLAIKLPRDQYPKSRLLQLPLLQKVIGRDTDIVITPSGKKLIVHSFTGIFEYFPEIDQFCVIQTVTTGIKIQFIPGTNFTFEILHKIEKTLTTLIAEPFDITFEQVDRIPATASGKPQIIISLLK